jgi:hypothetical protein
LPQKQAKIQQTAKPRPPRKNQVVVRVLLRIAKGDATHASAKGPLAQHNWRIQMNIRSKLLLLAGLSLAACAELAPTGTAVDGSPFLSTVPESVRAIAAPDQNLDKVVFLEQDNCYWYEHAGPVETTLLPLRTARGNMICAEPPLPSES